MVVLSEEINLLYVKAYTAHIKHMVVLSEEIYVL